MNIQQLVEVAIHKQASDIFLIAGSSVAFKIFNQVEAQSGSILSASEIELTIAELYTLSHRSRHRLETQGDDDFSIGLPKLARLRVNIYQQRGSYSVVIRMVSFHIPDPKEYHIPNQVLSLCELKKGLVVISGPAGSGKSTTSAILLDYINQNKALHIVTIEDPIEYLHTHKKSLISQREVGTDTISAASALKAALRQAPNVLLISEVRDLETISLAITAAETGHLVFTTLHTLGASNTIDRMIDVFPAEQQTQIRLQLSMVLEAVVSQQLIKTVDNYLVPVFELMKANTAVRNQIRDSKTHQLSLSIEAGQSDEMMSMNNSLLELVKNKRIDKEDALKHSYDRSALERLLSKQV
jgi:twitching motility protein PilT